MITTWTDGDEAIRREQETDARDAKQAVCMLCGDPIDGEPEEFWTSGGENHRAHPDCSEAWAAIMGERNALSVLEVRNHCREVIKGGVVITYEQRESGEREWQTVKLFRPTG